MDEEKGWIQRALAGDQTAFAQLVEAYQTPVYNLAYRMLGDSVEAEDAAQEAFVRAYTRLRSYDPERKFASWILSIVSHHCIDRLRRRRTSHISLEDLLAQRAFSDPGDGPERIALQLETRDSVRALLQDLPDQYRLVLILRYWHELSYGEMAEVLDTTEGAIKSRLHRARCLLAQKLGALEGQDAGHISLPIPTLHSHKGVIQNALSTSH